VSVRDRNPDSSAELTSRTALRAHAAVDAEPVDSVRSVRSVPDPPGPVSEPSTAFVTKTRKWALVAVVVLSFGGAAAVAAPLWIAIVFGAVMAISAYRPYRLLRTKLGGRSTWAAGLTTLACGLLAALAGALILVALTNELMKLVAHLHQHGSSGSLEGLIGARPTRAIEELGVDTDKLYGWAQKEVEAAASVAASAAALVIRTTSEALLGLVVGLLTMYYMLIEGPRLSLRIERIAPLEPRHTRALLAEAREVGRTAFIGTLATAAVQGLLAGIGYALVGVPQPVTWALVTALASFLPVIGTALVWVPICGYLLMEGHPVRAVILVVYGILVITSLADYVIRPRIVRGRGHGHPLLTLIALLGGIEVFGLAGLIIAPIVMSVFVAAFRLYEREVRAGVVPGTTTHPGVGPASRP
jgi:predicted PurR-regulated permease PerM